MKKILLSFLLISLIGIVVYGKSIKLAGSFQVGCFINTSMILYFIVSVLVTKGIQVLAISRKYRLKKP